MTATASLSLLPWVRQGAASAITTDDDLIPGQSGVAEVAAALALNHAPVPAVSVQLRGPADVLGIDTNQVVRTDPRPGSINFEPNCFPSIEFDRPDFPWLFTPLQANVNQRLRPWLCLVVVRKQEGVTLVSSSDGPLPSLQIAASVNPVVELPDLKDSWAWAHAQVATDDHSPQKIREALNGGPERSLSRLVCPRILAPDTDYIACVVPTFELGRKAGLGLPLADDDPTPAKIGLAPAWSFVSAPPTPEPEPVVLPVYYHWEFRTGPLGDFKSLASGLTAAVPEGLGTRTIDVAHLGFPVTGVANIGLEGALAPITPPGTQEPPPPAGSPSPEPVYSVPLTFQTPLAAILNEPSRRQAASPDADPLLAPPIYGQWHAARGMVTPEGAPWLDELNLDPRWRVAAAFGTRVIQEHQEALMSSAWEQAAELATVNQRMRQFQMSMAVGESLHARHFSRFKKGIPHSEEEDEEMTLRVAAPAFGRLRLKNQPDSASAAGSTLLATQGRSQLPLGATRSAMRRLGRLRGPLSRRISTQEGMTRTTTWVAAMLQNGTGGGPAPPPLPSSDWSIPNPDDLKKSSHFGAFFVAPENAPVPSPGADVPGDPEAPGFFRKAALDHIARFFIPHIGFKENVIPLPSIQAQVLEALHPSNTLPPLVKAVITTGDNVLPPTAPGVQPIGVETVMAAPRFPQPMYEPLRDLSQDLLLPGLETVKPNTVLGLQTNRRFVEAYMVGLNHEMGRELLWRGFPTDQRGTYFNHFWGLGAPNQAPADIDDLNTWTQRPLGQPPSAPVHEQFVMLIRSSLLQRYPNAVIYLTPAISKVTLATPSTLEPDIRPDHEVLPIFIGSMQPDVTFFGFPIATDAAIGTNDGLGYYVVIQEHPTEPRFGLDDGLALGNASHLSIGPNPPPSLPLNGHVWGKNAAEMAAITRRRPVRVAIHAKRLITPAGQPT